MRYQKHITETIKNIHNELKDLNIDNVQIIYEKNIGEFSRVYFRAKTNINIESSFCGNNSFLWDRLVIFIKMLYSFENYKIKITPEFLENVFSNCFWR